MAKAKGKMDLGDDYDIDQVIEGFKKELGNEAMFSAITACDVERMPTGIFALDYATGGGFPTGRTTEIYGPEGGGKTNLLLKAMATAQVTYPDRKPAFIDVEKTLTPEWAKSMGVNPDKVVYARPDYAEQAVDMMEKIAMARGVSIVGLDSIAAMITSSEADKPTDGESPGVAARVCSKMARRLPLALGLAEKAIMAGQRHGPLPAIVCINQIRTKIGVMYGSNEDTPGGNAIRFMYALRLRNYGKNFVDNKISDTLPIYKENTVMLKKWKIPVLAQEAEFNLVMQPFKTFHVGDVLDWNTLEVMMKESGVLQKLEKGGYQMFQDVYPKLVDCRDFYYANTEFRTMLHRAFIEQAFLDVSNVSLDSMTVVEDETAD